MASLRIKLARCVGRRLLPRLLFTAVVLSALTLLVAVPPNKTVQEQHINNSSNVADRDNFADLFRALRRYPVSESSNQADLFLYDSLGKYLHAIEEECVEPLGVPCSHLSVLNVLVISTWRSGSTFLGELLQSHPGSFYFYEPFLPYGNKLIRSAREVEEARTRLSGLFACDYSALADLVKYAKSNGDLFFRNDRLNTFCDGKLFKSFCHRPDVVGSICSTLKIRLMKVVRLSAKDAFLLAMKSGLPNLKILYLVRDPRGTLFSRKFLPWCSNSECGSPKILCTNLESDFYSVRDWLKTHPRMIRTVRYEELAQNVLRETADILQFLGLKMRRKILDFISSHTEGTKETEAQPWNTFRSSKDLPHKWKAMNQSDLQEIEKNCKNALTLWGYNVSSI